MALRILDSGCCETLKAGVHGLALGLAVAMGAYNIAAFMRRRQQHLAINAVLYGMAIFWEHQHVARHWASRKRHLDDGQPHRPPVSMPARPRLVPNPPEEDDREEPVWQPIAV